MFTLRESNLHPVVCVRDQNHAVSASEYMRLLGGLVEKLSTHGNRLALCFEDSYLFSLAMFAALVLGKKVVILPNNKPGTLRSLQAEYDEVLSEEIFVGVGPLSESPIYEIDKESRFVFLTSGTSGIPKKIDKRFENLFLEVQNLEETFSSQKGNICLASVSHQHIYGFLFHVLWPLCTKQTWMSKRIEYPEQLISKVKNLESFTLISTPAFLKRFFVPGVILQNCSSVFSSGGLLESSVSKSNAQSFGVIPIEVLGSTESGGVAYRQQVVDGTAWKTFSPVRFQIREHEQLFVQSPFFDEPELAMGDRAKALSHGFVLLGRSDDIVKVEEKRVSLAELRSQILEFPWVQEAAVLFLEEGHRQQTVCVAVLSQEGLSHQLEQGEAFVVQSIRDHLRSNFEASVIPRKFRFVAELPYNAQSKLNKSELLGLFASIDPLDVRVLEQNSRQLILDILFSLKSGLFEGHFPDFPLLAGVIQSDIAITLFEKYQGQKIRFGGFKAIKFFSPILPETRVRLRCEFEPEKSQMSFQYSQGEKVFSKGVVIHEG